MFTANKAKLLHQTDSYIKKSGQKKGDNRIIQHNKIIISILVQLLEHSFVL